MAHSRATNDKDAFLVKYKPNGDVAWTRTYHDWGNDMGNAVAVDRVGHVYLAVDDCCLLKCDSSGGLMWSKHSLWYGSALACDSNDNIYEGGASPIDENNRSEHILVKLHKQCARHQPKDENDAKICAEIVAGAGGICHQHDGCRE